MYKVRKLFQYVSQTKDFWTMLTPNKFFYTTELMKTLKDYEICSNSVETDFGRIHFWQKLPLLWKKKIESRINE